MIWWWAHDERGEELLTAQEVYEDMQIARKSGDNNPRLVLIERIEQWVAGVTAA